MVAVGRADAGHRSVVVVPETVLRAIDPQQMQGDARVRLVPAAQQRDGVVAERRPRVPQPQRPAADATRVQGGVHGGESGGGFVAEGAALGRQLQVVGGAVDEAGAQVVLELAQGAGERGLAHVQAGGGAGDVALLGDDEEGAQMPQLDGHASQA